MCKVGLDAAEKKRGKMIDLSYHKKETKDSSEYGKLILFMVPLIAGFLFLMEAML